MNAFIRPSVWAPWCLIAGTLALSACGGDSSDRAALDTGAGYQATIERTTYGIPHITANSYGGAGYGHGYAIAEDNLCVLASAFVTFRGERSQYFGPDAEAAPMGTFGAPRNEDADFFFRFVVNDDQVAMFRDAQPADVRQLSRGFAAGFSRYVREVKGGDHAGRHLDCRDQPWLAPVTEQDVFRRLVALNLAASSANLLEEIVSAQPPSASARRLVSDAQDDHRFWVGGEEGIGSNTLAFGGDATESGGGLLFGNPHWYLEGVDRFYQLQMTIPGELNVSGVSIMGAPMVLLGFNNDIAWTHTVSTARRFTPYLLQMADETQYIKDGEQRALEAVDITIQIKQPDGSLLPKTKTLYRSEYGPMIDFGNPGLPAWSDTTAITLRDVNLENTRSFQNFLAFDKAESLDDFFAAINEHVGIPWVNTTAIGRGDDRALYSDITAVPNVPDSLLGGCQVAALGAGLPLLNGASSACDWQQDADAVLPGAFGPSNLPHLFRRDYVANMNDSYWLTNPGAPLTGFAAIMGQEDYEQGLRSRMGHTLVEDRFNSRDGFAGSQINSVRLRDIVLNSRVLSAELLKEPVLAAVCGGTLSADQQLACQVLQNWDHTGNLNAVGAHLWSAIWLHLYDIENLYAVPFDANDPVHTPSGLNTGDSAVISAVQQGFNDGVADVVASGQALDAPLGEVQTYAKAGTDIPQYGGEGYEGYFTVLRNTYLHVVDFPEGEPVRAYTMLSHGVSTDPTSPHYSDYTEAYSRKQWHRVPFTREQIKNARLSITEISE